MTTMLPTLPHENAFRTQAFALAPATGEGLPAGPFVVSSVPAGRPHGLDMRGGDHAG